MPLTSDVTTGPTPAPKPTGGRKPAHEDPIRQHPLHDGQESVPATYTSDSTALPLHDDRAGAFIASAPPRLSETLMMHPLHDGRESVKMQLEPEIGALPRHDNAAARLGAQTPASLSDWIEGNREATNSSAPADAKPGGGRGRPGRELTSFVDPDRIAALRDRIKDLRDGGRAWVAGSGYPMTSGHWAETDASDGDLARADMLSEKLGRLTADNRTGPHAKQMSWEAYQALDPDQRAAVDFNTLLVRAREKDLNTDYNPTDEQRTAYHNKMEAVMGAGNGSRTYAPETLALLDQIGYEGHGEDFDSFLSLKNAINSRELKDFDVDKVRLLSQSDAAREPAGEDYSHMSITGIGGTTDYAEAAAAINTAEVERAMVRSNALLNNLNRSFVLDRADDVSVIGGTVLSDEKSVKPLGFGDNSMRDADHQDVDQAFNSWYASLSNQANQDPEKWSALWGTINSTLDQTDDHTRQAFWKFLDLKTRQAKEHGFDEPRAPGLKGDQLVDVDELRRKLGLNGG